MNSDKIKWMVERSEGFELSTVRNNTIEMIDICGLVSYAIESLNRSPSKVPWENAYKPLLLQRTIEGLIKAEICYFDYYYNNGKACIDMEYRDNPIPTKKGDTFDEAKQAAIDYVYEQEQEK